MLQHVVSGEDRTSRKPRGSGATRRLIIEPCLAYRQGQIEMQSIDRLKIAVDRWQSKPSTAARDPLELQAYVLRLLLTTAQRVESDQVLVGVPEFRIQIDRETVLRQRLRHPIESVECIAPDIEQHGLRFRRHGRKATPNESDGVRGPTRAM